MYVTDIMLLGYNGIKGYTTHKQQCKI